MGVMLTPIVRSNVASIAIARQIAAQTAARVAIATPLSGGGIHGFDARHCYPANAGRNRLCKRPPMGSGARHMSTTSGPSSGGGGGGGGGVSSKAFRSYDASKLKQQLAAKANKKVFPPTKWQQLIAASNDKPDVDADIQLQAFAARAMAERAHTAPPSKP